MEQRVSSYAFSDAKDAPRPGRSLSRDLTERLCRFTPAQRTLIERNLSEADLKVIHDAADYLPLAILQGIPSESWMLLERRYTVRDALHYLASQKSWISDENWFLGTRLGRAPSSEEAVEDFQHRNLGLKFRAYYILRFMKDPSKIERNLQPARLLAA